MKRINIKLESIMEERGITQSKLSDDANVRAASISSLRKNNAERVDLSILARLCDVLDITDMNDLFEIIDDDIDK